MDSAIAEKLREKMIAQPEVILEDRDLMRALVAGHDRAMGENVVDMRGLAMERLEARLDRLEATHDTVLAAAYENLAGMNQIHRAVLQILEPGEFSALLAALDGEVRSILRVDSLRLVLESAAATGDEAAALGGAVLHLAPPGTCAEYTGGADRAVVLRRSGDGAIEVHGTTGIRSEALMLLDLGEGRLPAMLVLGSDQAAQFAPGQATDLLAFLAQALERALRRWLG